MRQDWTGAGTDPIIQNQIGLDSARPDQIGQTDKEQKMKPAAACLRLHNEAPPFASEWNPAI